MAKTVVIDELHLTISVPHDLPEAQREAIRQTLVGDDFMDLLGRAVRAFPELTVVSVSLSR